ncbi:MAG: outer membrane protein assembly factor BamD [Candidatus Omnitrophica bacterium]|nr:outer membrane protein assembly factor BamD [Candidatus Omnitrophota bacterium]
MRKKTVMVFLVFLISFTPLIYGYWEWTPKTGKWINPKYAVKSTDREQWEYAESFKIAGNNEVALREYAKLVKHYPLSPLAPAALFESAKIYLKTGDRENAFNKLDEIIKRYPEYPEIEQVLKVQREISIELLKKKQLRFVDKLKDPTKKYEAISRAIDSDPFSQETPQVALQLAEKYAKNRDMEKAMKIYQQIIRDFPDSQWEEKARYEMLMNEIEGIPEASADDSKFSAIEKSIDSFIFEFPSSPYRPSLEKKKAELRNEIARRLFNIAEIYKKNGYKKSADIYFKKIKKLYPETEYAKKCPPDIN